MSDLDTFTYYPLQIEPQTKVVSGIDGSNDALNSELAAVNQLHKALLGLEGGPAAGGAPPGVPPPPIPVNPKRTANVNKLRDSGNVEFRKGKYADAIKLYSLGLQMALGRPMWEPPQLVHEEVATLYANRAQAHMAMQRWPEGAVDAASSVEAKKTGNAKAWWRRGKCLLEMGRLEEAKTWVQRGLEMEGEEADLLALRKEIEAQIARTAATL